MEIRFAKIITYLLHPLLVPSYGMLLIFHIFSGIYFMNDTRFLLLLVGITFVSTAILPGLSVFILLRLGMINGIEMDERRDRFLPYLVTTLFYFFAFYMLRDFPLPSRMLKFIQIFILGAILSLLLTSAINLKTKISAHLVAWGGLTAVLLMLCMIPQLASVRILYLVIFLSGLVAYARLRLEAHSPKQVYGGYLLGFFSVLCLYVFSRWT